MQREGAGLQLEELSILRCPLRSPRQATRASVQEEGRESTQKWPNLVKKNADGFCWGALSAAALGTFTDSLTSSSLRRKSPGATAPDPNRVDAAICAVQKILKKKNKENNQGGPGSFGLNSMAGSKESDRVSAMAMYASALRIVLPFRREIGTWRSATRPQDIPSEPVEILHPREAFRRSSSSFEYSWRLQR